MANDERGRPSLKDFDAYTDRNGQNVGGTSLPDVGVPSRTRADLERNPNSDAKTARIASGMPRQDATDATATETPEAKLRRIADAGSGIDRESGAVDEAIERATAAVGKDDEG